MAPHELTRAMKDGNRRMYAWPTLGFKALRTLIATRNPTAAMFAWSSNVNYRNVSFGKQREEAAGGALLP
jgi:hypothetical protein